MISFDYHAKASGNAGKAVKAVKNQSKTLRRRTGSWLGWVNIATDPWIYLDDLGDYIYLPNVQTGEMGACLYIVN